MGRHGSESPVRGRASPPRRRSPSRRERSPTRHKHSNPEKVSSHNRSPRPSRSRSPMHRSSVREKQRTVTRNKSPAPRSPVKQQTVTRNKSPKRVKPRSPSPKFRHSVSKSRSPESRSPSPRSKRLKRVKPEYDVEKRSRKEYERKGDRVVGEEKNLDKDLPSESEKKDRKQGRDVINNSSRSRRETSASPEDWHRKGRRRSRSPYDADNRGRDERTSRRSSEDGNGNDDSIAKMKAAEEKLESKEKEKQKPSFELSGKLAEETNRFRGITLLFNEPPDARKPDVRWRLYVFKGGEVLNEPLYIHRQSCYLFGRERRVADIPTDHPSCSKQHAVLQYRQVEQENTDGTISKKVRPYLMDLGSTNKTFINDTPMEPQRYYELFEKDTIKFGNSSREYVLLHENSTT